jgi:hypothetical protein
MVRLTSRFGRLGVEVSPDDRDAKEPEAPAGA